MIVQTETPEANDRPKPVKPPYVRGIKRETLLTLAQCNFTCQYCGRNLLRDVGTFYEATVDHVWPKSHGGRRSRDNVVAACNLCNQLKGDYQPESIEDARAHIAAKRSEFVAYFLRMAEYSEVEIPTELTAEMTLKADLLAALGTYAGQAREIVQRVMTFEAQANVVLDWFLRQPQGENNETAGIFADVARSETDSLATTYTEEPTNI